MTLSVDIVRRYPKMPKSEKRLVIKKSEMTKPVPHLLQFSNDKYFFCFFFIFDYVLLEDAERKEKVI